MAAKTRTRGMTAMAMARMGTIGTSNGQGKNNRNCANWPQKLQVTKVNRYVLAAAEQPSSRVVGAGQMAAASEA